MIGYNEKTFAFFNETHTAIPYKHHKYWSAWLVIVNGHKGHVREIMTVVSPNAKEAALIALAQIEAFIKDKRASLYVLHPRRYPEMQSKEQETEEAARDPKQEGDLDLKSGRRDISPCDTNVQRPHRHKKKSPSVDDKKHLLAPRRGKSKKKGSKAKKSKKRA